MYNFESGTSAYFTCLKSMFDGISKVTRSYIKCGDNGDICAQAVWNGFPICVGLLHGVSPYRPASCYLVYHFPPPKCYTCKTSTKCVRHCYQKTFKKIVLKY